jgi:hypothetical protein
VEKGALRHQVSPTEDLRGLVRFNSETSRLRFRRCGEAGVRVLQTASRKSRRNRLDDLIFRGPKAGPLRHRYFVIADASEARWRCNAGAGRRAIARRHPFSGTPTALLAADVHQNGCANNCDCWLHQQLGIDPPPKGFQIPKGVCLRCPWTSPLSPSPNSPQDQAPPRAATTGETGDGHP